MDEAVGSSPSSYLDEYTSLNNPNSIPDTSIHPLHPSGVTAGGGDSQEWSDNKPARVAYPFEVVKPRGSERDLTLKDINRRLQMPPTRAVRHPVGEFAAGPSVADSGGPGLSGKAVVALTRIHTRGQGSITLIRTKDD